MNQKNMNILVVDDKKEAGLQIVEALWEGGFSVQFVQYDPKKIIKFKNNKKEMRGVRIVFMDINLIGGAMGSDSLNFSVIQTTLETLLSKENGPYLLITWSTHDDYAERLFSFLAERLPEERKPIATRRLSKTDFSGRNARKLPEVVRNMLADLGIAECLVAWENLVHRASTSTLNSVSGLANNLPDHANHVNREGKLGAVIRAFSEAEAADHLTKDSAFPALSSVLAQILQDEMHSLLPNISNKCGSAIISMGKAEAPEWSGKVHRALHIEYSSLKRMHAPGDVFLFPAFEKRNRGGLPKIKMEDFLVSQFFDVKKWNNASADIRQQISNDSKIILVEITPPCDHAQLKKLLWHRYVIGAELGGAAIKFLIKGDYLMRLPTFVNSTNSGRTVVLNSRATATIPPEKSVDLGGRQYRLRSQLLSDVIRWVSSQQARLGYISVK